MDAGEDNDRIREASTLCAACGLCCSGLLFAHVRVEAGRDAATRRHIDLDVPAGRGIRIAHPCPFLDGAACSIYDDRPSRCRSYSCRTRRQLLNGTIGADEAAARVDDMKRRLAALAETGAGIVTRALHRIGFRGFCTELQRVVETRIADGRPVPPGERDALRQAFAIVQRVDRDFEDTGRLERLADLVMRAERDPAAPGPD